MLALPAPDAYVCPQPHYLPLVAAARVRFLKPDNVTKFEFHHHWNHSVRTLFSADGVNLVVQVSGSTSGRLGEVFVLGGVDSMIEQIKNYRSRAAFGEVSALFADSLRGLGR